MELGSRDPSGDAFAADAAGSELATVQTPVLALGEPPQFSFSGLSRVLKYAKRPGERRFA